MGNVKVVSTAGKKAYFFQLILRTQAKMSPEVGRIFSLIDPF